MLVKNYMSTVSKGIKMNRRYGFTLLEVLVSLTIALVIISGVCCLILILPKLVYYQYITPIEQIKFADFIFAMEKDFKNAGFGINDILPLISFKSADIKIVDEEMSLIECYWNYLGVISKTLQSIDLNKGSVIISRIDGLREGDYSIIAELSPEPHWAIIKIEKIIVDSEDDAMLVIYKAVSVKQFSERKFKSGAYFVPARKISYIYFKKNRYIARVINDGLRQPFIEEIDGLNIKWCRYNEREMNNCIQVVMYVNTLGKARRYFYSIYLPNL